jgi:drug/metabolite transporter (DMT)-like permease
VTAFLSVTSSRGRVGLALLLAVVYAACYSAIKAGLAFAPPLRFAGFRAALAGAVVLVALAVLRRPLLPPRRFWAGTLALAVLGTFLGYGAMFLAPGRTGAGIASVLGNTGPLMIIVLAALFLDEPVTSTKLAALLLGTLGVTLIAWPAFTDPARSGAAGASLPLLAAAAAAGSSVLLKRLEVGEAVFSVAAWQLLLGSVPLLAASAALEGSEAVRWGVTFLALLLFLALVGTAFALSLWYWLVQREDVGRLSLLLFLVPVLGLALAGILFDERIGGAEIAGIGLTLAGIGLVVRAAHRAAKMAAETSGPTIASSEP